VQLWISFFFCASVLDFNDWPVSATLVHPLLTFVLNAINLNGLIQSSTKAKAVRHKICAKRKMKLEDHDT